jgi:hypothetical protein
MAMTMVEAKKDRIRFEIYMKDGKIIHGAAETKALCFDHLRHCLSADHKNEIKAAWYTGRDGHSTPVQVTL